MLVVKLLKLSKKMNFYTQAARTGSLFFTYIWAKAKPISAVLLTLMLLQTSAAQRSTGSWISYTGNHKINTAWNWWVDGSYRTYHVLNDMLQGIIRTGVGYNLTENNNVLAGFAYSYAEKYTTATAKHGSGEFRLYQQFLNKQAYGRVALQNRYRLEERFMEDGFHLRLRYHLSLLVPIHNKTLQSHTLYTYLYNELFLNTRPSIFDRNRSYIGLGYVINKYLRLDAGYMAQVLEHSRTNQLMLTLVHNSVLKK